MSAKFDRCPICGCGVGSTKVGDNKDLYLAICAKGHTIQDLTSNYHGKARSTEWDAAKCWNREVRKYLNNKD